MEEFLGEYHAQITGSYIAKQKKLNQKTVSNYLNRLEKEGILKSKNQGKNKLYFLNLHNKEIIKKFIIAAENLRTLQFYKKHPLVTEIAEKICPLIKGTAVIFGSYAKGLEKNDSDIDILVIGQCNHNEIENISKMFKKEISLKVYPKFKKDILTTEAIKDHIIIKNAEKFVGMILNE